MRVPGEMVWWMGKVRISVHPVCSPWLFFSRAGRNDYSKIELVLMGFNVLRCQAKRCGQLATVTRASTTRTDPTAAASKNLILSFKLVWNDWDHCKSLQGFGPPRRLVPYTCSGIMWRCSVSIFSVYMWVCLHTCIWIYMYIYVYLIVFPHACLCMCVHLHVYRTFVQSASYVAPIIGCYLNLCSTSVYLWVYICI